MDMALETAWLSKLQSRTFREFQEILINIPGFLNRYVWGKQSVDKLSELGLKDIEFKSYPGTFDLTIAISFLSSRKTDRFRAPTYRHATFIL